MIFLFFLIISSCSIFKTGEKINRENLNDGAVLARIMNSHIRVGTFEYATFFGNINYLNSLTNYTVKRLYPNMNVDSGKWNNVKKELSIKLGEITLLWNCGIKQREHIFNNNIISFYSEDLSIDMLALGKKTSNIVQNIIMINITEEILKIIFFLFDKIKFFIFSLRVLVFITERSSSVIRSYFLKHIVKFRHFYNILIHF